MSLITSTPGLMTGASLILEMNGKSQTLFALGELADDPHFELYFAGDLDGDGKLDLLATMSPKYSAYPRTVLLSSAAKSGELVHEVATFHDSAC